MELRQYQKRAVESCFSCWEAGKKNILLVLPTGTGKTIIFVDIAKRIVASGGRVLVLAHREELLQQAIEKFGQVGIVPGLERAGSRANGDPVIVASVQTMSRESRLNRYPKDAFALIIVDEAHHVLAETYMRIIRYFDAKVLGVTATPDRGDMKNLGKVFEELAYEYSMISAVQEGYLCRIFARTIPVEIDLSNVSVRSGDFVAEELGHAIELVIDQVSDKIVEFAKDRKIVVFLPLVSTAKKFAEAIDARGIRTEEIDGESPDREEILKRFKSNKTQCLCNAMLLTEGWDCPEVDCIVPLRPTKIRALYAQMVGRGTRPAPGKKNLLLLDFLWHTERHELVRPASLVAKSKEVTKKATQILEEVPFGMDLFALEEKAEKAIVHEREISLAKELESLRHRRGDLVDPLQYAVSIADESLFDYTPTFQWEYAPPTQKQLEAIERAGIDPSIVTTAGHASAILNALAIRRLAGLATPKQIRFLERKGFRRVGEWTFKQANRIISIIQQNGWKTPYYINPATYAPEQEVQE